MTKHMQREIEKLKEAIVSLGEIVEGRVIKAIESIEEKSIEKALAVITGDEEIDQLEVELEEECLKLLALHQPVAIDLRFVIAVLKINNDIERIGDHAVNIAQRSRRLTEVKGAVSRKDIEAMASRVRHMLKISLSSLVLMDAFTARQVFACDQEIDDFNRNMHKWFVDEVKHHPELAEELLLILSVSRQLERIADLASNIAEDVVYMIEGEIIRHGRDRKAELPMRH